jgi:hypothetical protein
LPITPNSSGVIVSQSNEVEGELEVMGTSSEGQSEGIINSSPHLSESFASPSSLTSSSNFPNIHFNPSIITTIGEKGCVFPSLILAYSSQRLIFLKNSTGLDGKTLNLSMSFAVNVEGTIKKINSPHVEMFLAECLWLMACDINLTDISKKIKARFQQTHYLNEILVKLLLKSQMLMAYVVVLVDNFKANTFKHIFK